MERLGEGLSEDGTEQGKRDLCGGGDEGDGERGGDSELVACLGAAMIKLGLHVRRSAKGLDRVKESFL